MNIALFGATGGTGRQLLDQALAAGHAVTALARDPARLPVIHEQLTLVTGDVRDAAAVAAVVRGADAVIVTLGASQGSPADICSIGTAQVIAAMQQAGARRLVVITSLGVGDSKNQVPLAFKLLMKTALRAVMADKEAQEALVMASGLDWTIVRPGGLTHGPGSGQYRFGLDQNIVAGQVARADVAAFVLQQLGDDTFLYKTPAIT